MGKIRNTKPKKGPRIRTHEVPKSPPPNKGRPIFSFLYLRKSHCITNCIQQEKASFADTMYNLSQLKWDEIFSSGRHGLGSEKISRESFKVAIPKNITDDVTFLAFRFHKKAPMVGYRDGDTFHIIWFDRAFNVYSHS